MFGRSWRIASGWSGLLFIVVFLASESTLADSPKLADSPADTRAWFAANETEIAWVTLGVAVSIGLLFLFFASGIRSHLTEPDRIDGCVWTRLSFASAVAIVAVAGAKAGLWPALGHPEVSSAASDGLVKVLASIEVFALLTVIPWLLTGFLLGASIVVLRRGGMSKWLGWLGVVTSAFFVVGSSWIVGGEETGPLGMLVAAGYLGFLIWVAGASMNLIRAGSPEASEQPISATGSAHVEVRPW